MRRPFGRGNQCYPVGLYDHEIFDSVNDHATVFGPYDAIGSVALRGISHEHIPGGLLWPHP